MEVVSRKEAKSRGLVFYFTGVPCKRGHVSLRYVKSKYCRECKPAWEAANKDKVKSYEQTNRVRHKDQRSLATKDWRTRNLDDDRARNNQ